MSQERCYPCGMAYEELEAEQWKEEIGCQLVGCRSCKNFNGTEYFEKNIPRGVSMWAKHELESMV